MRINIKKTNYEMPDVVAEYLDKRLASIQKFLDESEGEAICDVELQHEHAQKHGRVFRAEINLNAQGEFFRVEAEEESMNAAIDGVHDEIARRLRKSKTKHMNLFRRGGAMIKKMMRE